MAGLLREAQKKQQKIPEQDIWSVRKTKENRDFNVFHPFSLQTTGERRKENRLLGKVAVLITDACPLPSSRILLCSLDTCSVLSSALDDGFLSLISVCFSFVLAACVSFFCLLLVFILLRRYLYQISLALQHMHAQRIMHRGRTGLFLFFFFSSLPLSAHRSTSSSFAPLLFCSLRFGSGFISPLWFLSWASLLHPLYFSLSPLPLFF